MGGSIELESTSERGTTFVISLPACEDTEIESIVTSTGPISARI
jgi:K+-sensing histidine kinase KdpD